MTELTPDEAELLLAGGRAAEALFAAEIGLARRPGDTGLQSLHQRAMAALSAMEPRFAALQLDAVVNEGRASAHLELGHAYVLREAWADAERCFARAAALDPGSVEAHASLGLASLNLGRGEAAERHSRRALAIDDAHVVASQTLAHILEAQGRGGAARPWASSIWARVWLATTWASSMARALRLWRSAASPRPRLRLARPREAWASTDPGSSAAARAKQRSASAHSSRRT